MIANDTNEDAGPSRPADSNNASVPGDRIELAYGGGIVREVREDGVTVIDLDWGARAYVLEAHRAVGAEEPCTQYDELLAMQLQATYDGAPFGDDSEAGDEDEGEEEDRAGNNSLRQIPFSPSAAPPRIIQFRNNRTVMPALEAYVDENGNYVFGLRPGASRAEISTLPVHAYTAKQDESASREGTSKKCMICQMDYEVGDQLRTLPCIHKYHAQCIDQWLRHKRTCPVCHHEI